MDFGSHITEIKSKDDMKQLKKKDKSVLLIYSEYCGHCHEFRDIYVELSKDLKNVDFYAVNSSSSIAKDIIRDNNIDIKGVPWITFFKHGKYSGSHMKSRDYESLFVELNDNKTNFFEGRVQSMKNLPESLDKNLVLFYSNQCHHCHDFKDEYSELSMLEKKHNFFAVEDKEQKLIKEMFDKYGVEVIGYPTLVLFTKGTAKVYSGSMRINAIRKFIKEEQYPMKTSTTSSKNGVYLVYTIQNEEEVLSIFEKHCEKLQSKKCYHIRTDDELYDEFLEKQNINKKNILVYPAIIYKKRLYMVDLYENFEDGIGRILKMIQEDKY